MTKYANLQELLAGEPAVKAYFDGLPSYVCDFCRTYANQINSPESLYSHIQNATRGDG